MKRGMDKRIAQLQHLKYTSVPPLPLLASVESPRGVCTVVPTLEHVLHQVETLLQQLQRDFDCFLETRSRLLEGLVTFSGLFPAFLGAGASCNHTSHPEILSDHVLHMRCHLEEMSAHAERMRRQVTTAPQLDAWTNSAWYTLPEEEGNEEDQDESDPLY